MPQQGISGRYPLETKAVGVLQNGRLKINILSILWSDHNDIVIYRKFEDFKKMDRELRRKFPLESGLFRKSEKMIPKLRDVPLIRRNRNTSRVIERLRLLINYSQDLLKTDSKISQCDVVMSFFTPTNSDLNPSFPENSLVIVPSEVREQHKREQPRQLPKPPSSEPIVSQMYLCIEDYETKDTKNCPFKVKQDERLGVLIKEISGWWLVENEEKRLAWFPAPFLRALEMNDDADSGSDSEDEGVRYYTAAAYEAISSDEVSIARGVLVEVIEKSNKGWWLIRYNGKTGFVPAMYLKPYRNGHHLQIMMNQGTSPMTSNLFKASSTLELNRPIGPWRNEEDHCVANAGATEQFKSRKLDRKKSKSINGLPSNNQYGFHSTPPELKPTEFAPSSGAECEPKPCSRGAIRKPCSDAVIATQQTPRPLPREQSAVDVLNMDEGSPSSAKTPTRNLISQLPPGNPQIPKRPDDQEILHKCTTVTKKALRRKAIAL
ncbi:NADPH oxidase organizer 1 [Mixophyes fleayi]|uniref:NADPH oxidase organizer 1 n=1 Tax=Mixophyes fleayi TaxID=3061075 RepID=UPI003F4DDFEB